MTKSKMFHLGLFGHYPVTHHNLATWMHPENMPRDFRFDRADVWMYLARLCESAKFDFMFCADHEGIMEEYQGSIDGAVRYAAQCPLYDAVTLMTFAAAATRRLGIVATVSTNGSRPYRTARRFATLDNLTGGRAGWNVVTAFHRAASLNLGTEPLPREERYAQAEEYLDLCYKLWDSWEPDAVVEDVATQTFADPAKVHHINYEGKHFRSRGPLNVHRSPQGHPVIAQAGASTAGIQFAARHAELVFAIQPFIEGMKKYHDGIKGVMKDEFGRDPDSCKICWSFQPIVGQTEEIAKEKQAQINERIPQEGGLALLSGHLGTDLSQLPPDTPLEGLEVPGVQGLVNMYTVASNDSVKTIGDMARIHGRGVGTPQIVGTGEQIADWMEDVVTQVGGDGFMLSPTHIPGAIEEFIDMVMPVLRERGLVRTEYQGTTLRENLLAF